MTSYRTLGCEIIAALMKEDRTVQDLRVMCGVETCKNDNARRIAAAQDEARWQIRLLAAAYGILMDENGRVIR